MNTIKQPNRKSPKQYNQPQKQNKERAAGRYKNKKDCPKQDSPLKFQKISRKRKGAARYILLS